MKLPGIQALLAQLLYQPSGVVLVHIDQDAYSSQRKGEKRKGRARSFPLRIYPEVHVLIFYSYPIGQNLVTWPYLTARNAGKYSLHSWWPYIQLKIFYRHGRRENKCWRKTSSPCYNQSGPVFLLGCGLSFQSVDSNLYFRKFFSLTPVKFLYSIYCVLYFRNAKYTSSVHLLYFNFCICIWILCTSLQF